MSKTDNLTEYLTGLADKFRAVLGISTPLQVQSFEDLIDQAYAKGRTDSGSVSSASEGEAFYYSLICYIAE